LTGFETLLAGTAKRSISPRGTVDLSGYAARTQPSTGIHDDISVRAVVLRQGDDQVAICSLETLGLDPAHVQYLREELAADGYAPEDLLFACAHTHGAPAVQRLRGCGAPSQDYVDRLLTETVQCVRQAGQELAECEANVGRAQCDLGINRRVKGTSGLVLGDNPEGVRDPELVAVHLRAATGETVGVIYNYACHAVVLGGENRLVSGDWPGEACRRLESEFGGTVLCLQGCCGDVNPRIRGGFEAVAEAGEVVAASVREAMESAAQIRSTELSTFSRRVDLPLAPLPSDEELRARLAEIEGMPEEQRGYAEVRDLAWASDALTHPEEARRAAIGVDVGEIRIGDAVIAWIPGEAFCEYALRIKAARKPGRTMVAAYSNGNIGYIPTAAEFANGGYEVTDAYRYYAYQMLTPQAEEVILGSFQP